jgi:hypothetical protein
MISVSLYANNHQPLAVDGEQVTDMVMIADMMASTESRLNVQTVVK